MHPMKKFHYTVAPSQKNEIAYKNIERKPQIAAWKACLLDTSRFYIPQQHHMLYMMEAINWKTQAAIARTKKPTIEVSADLIEPEAVRRFIDWSNWMEL